MHADRQAGARRQVEHVTVTEQLLGAALIEDGARVNLARHLEGHARRDVGLDQTGDHVHRRTLGGENQMDPAARAFCAMRAISSSTFLPTIIIMSANSSTTTTMVGRLFR